MRLVDTYQLLSTSPETKVKCRTDPYALIETKVVFRYKKFILPINDEILTFIQGGRMNRRLCKSGLIGAMCAFLFLGNVGVPAASVDVNDDGRALIAQAAQSYAEEIRERPIVTDEAYLSYLQKVVK